MIDLTQEIRKITSKYGKEFIANDVFLDVLKSKFPMKDVELNKKWIVYNVLQNEKVLLQLITMQKKDIPEYIKKEMSFLSANYSLEEDIIGTVFKELLVGSGIAQESNGIENHNITEKISISNSSKRLRNKKSRLKIGIGKIDKSSVYCILSIFWAMICLFFSPVIPLSIDDEFDVPGIIPSIVHYIVFVAPLLFVLTSTKQSQTLKSVVGGALVSVVIFAGLFFSFGFFYYDFCPFFSEYDRDMPYVTNFVGKLISNNFIVIFVSMLISSLFGWLAVLLVLFIKGQKFSEIIKLFRQNKRIFLLSLAVFTIFIITVGYFFLKWGIIKRLVLFMGEFVANVWVIIVVFVVFGLLACGK